MLGTVLEEVRDAVLQGRGRRERDELVHAAELGAQARRGHAVGHLPPRRVVGLAERGDHEAARKEIRVAAKAHVRPAVEEDVLVDLVAHHVDVAASHHRAQSRDVVLAPDGACGVVGRVDDDETRLRADGVVYPIPVDAEVGSVERQVTTDAAGERHCGFVRVVAGVEDDHLVPGADDGVDGAEERLRGTGCHGHLGLGTHADAVEVCHLAGNRLAQGFDPGHRRILVVAVGQVVAHPLEKLRRTVEVGIALRQVDRPLVGRELRHDREDRRADVRQLAFERHSHGPRRLRKARFCHSPWCADVHVRIRGSVTQPDRPQVMIRP